MAMATAFAAIAYGHSASPTASGHDGYRLVFADEFDLPDGSQPDSTVWGRCKRYNHGWNRWISTSTEVVYIKKGKLVLKAIPNTIEPTDTAPMLTGAIESRGKLGFQYGRVDVRMKSSHKTGNFPAAWMKPETIDPNRYGEIDIVEGCGDLKVAQQTLHNHLSVVLKKKYGQNAFRKDLKMDKWHIYSVVWTPTRITFLIDNKETGTYNKVTDKSILQQGQWTFDRPFYLILNQSVGNGLYPCMMPLMDETYETQVDWVRVYQK